MTKEYQEGSEEFLKVCPSKSEAQPVQACPFHLRPRPADSMAYRRRKWNRSRVYQQRTGKDHSSYRASQGPRRNRWCSCERQIVAEDKEILLANFDVKRAPCKHVLRATVHRDERVGWSSLYRLAKGHLCCSSLVQRISSSELVPLNLAHWFRLGLQD